MKGVKPGVSDRWRMFWTAVWSVGLVTLAVAEEGKAVGARVREGLPSYDPNFGTRAVTPAVRVDVRAEDSFPGHAPRPRLMQVPPPRRVAEANAAVLAGTAPVVAAEMEPVDGEIMELPEMMVEEKRLPGGSLPRLQVAQPKKAVAIDPNRPLSEQLDLLEEKHLSAFDRLVLNRFQLLGSNARRALEAEQRERFALSMNELAEAIDEAGLWGVSEEEKAELRKHYYQLLVDGPK